MGLSRGGELAPVSRGTRWIAWGLALQFIGVGTPVAGRSLLVRRVTNSHPAGS
jgi:hypothetical protein